MPDVPRLRAYYGAWVVRQTLAAADKLVAEADRFKQALEEHPEHFPSRYDSERIGILVPVIHELRGGISHHHNEKEIDKFNVDLRGIVQKHRTIEPLSVEARLFLGIEQRPTPSGPMDAFRDLCGECAALRQLLFTPIFEGEKKSFAEYYFDSEFFKPL